MNSDLSKYFNEDLKNPNYLYLGSAKEINFVELQRENAENNTFEMFLTSHYYTAGAIAFAEKLARKNKDQNYYIKIDSTKIPIMEANNVENLDEKDTAYIYVFEYNDDYVTTDNDFQFKTNTVQMPVVKLEITYKDFNTYYKVYDNSKKR